MRSSARREYRNRRRARALMQLVRQELPGEYDVTGDHDAWPLVGAALLSRATMTMRSILDLQLLGRAADAGTLCRSLYEHAVHLAWLGAEPSAERLERWRKHDLRSRLTADSDARQRNIQLLDAPERAVLEAQVGAMKGHKIVLEQLAESADAHWNGRLPAMGSASQQQSFRGLYAILYRQYSGTAHPSYRGINPVVEDITATRKRVVLEKRFEGRGPYGMATVLYGLALLVASESLGWPAGGQVTAAFESTRPRRSRETVSRTVSPNRHF